jgi:hypothetical protein
MPEWDPKKIERLIDELASDDSFARLEAIEKLEKLTKLTFGFRFNDSPDVRSMAVERWKDWWKEQQREREHDKIQAAIHLQGGMLDLGAIKKAIKEIPAEKIQGYLNALILKMKSQRPRCDTCNIRPATVSVTEIEGEVHSTRHICDVCAQERGDLMV